VTDNHPYWVIGTGWVDSGLLKPGMRIEAFDRGALVVESLVAKNVNEVTYNFTVGDFHTYFVGGQRALVHNCSVRCTRIGDLKPMMDDAHIAPRPALQNFSDDELLKPAREPLDGQLIRRNTENGSLVNGSGRVHELQHRARDSNSKITEDMTVPVEEYKPDRSMFWDLE